MDHGRSSADDNLPIADLLQRLDALERRTGELERLVVEKDAIIAAQRVQIETLQAALDRAEEQLALFKKMLFGPRRERYVPAPNQQLLFAAVPLDESKAVSEESAVSPDTSSSNAASPEASSLPNSPPKPPRKSRRKFVIPDFLPVRREEHRLPAEECSCGHCGRERVVIGTRVTQQIELEAAKAYVVEHVRYTYACRGCRSGDQVVTTAKPLAPIDKSPFGASLLAWIVSAKFERHLPTYRHQEMLVAPLGLWLSRGLLWKLLAGTARCLKPLAAQLRAEILASYVVQADETPVRYLGDEPGKSSQGYLFGYAGDAEHRFLVYDFRSNRSREGPREVLADYRGVLQTDGYSAYESLTTEFSDRLTPAGCWMHARRNFDEALATTSHPLVAESLARIQLLYDIDDRTKELSLDARRALHERESRPIVDHLFASWQAALPTLRPTTKLAEAIAYATCRQAELTRFFDDGRIQLDTGHLERSIRPVAIGRKNYLFFGSLRGGQTAATLYSVVQSARLYHLDVTAYLTDILRRLPAILPTDTAAIRPLLPDEWAKSHPQHILESRDQELQAAATRRRKNRTRRRATMAER
jgi:transposase